jgi:hypothetical protein
MSEITKQTTPECPCCGEALGVPADQAPANQYAHITGTERGRTACAAAEANHMVQAGPPAKTYRAMKSNEVEAVELGRVSGATDLELVNGLKALGAIPAATPFSDCVVDEYAPNFLIVAVCGEVVAHLSEVR